MRLSLFGNVFGGRLELPAPANFSTLFAHNNLLSCPIGIGNTTMVNPQQNLVLPGNLFSAPIPPWAETSGVAFLYYSSWWQAWGVALVSSIVGLVFFLAALLLAMRKTNGWADFMRGLLRSGRHEVQIRMLCARGLGLWSLLWVPLMIGLCCTGAKLLECGKPWQRGTISYLYDSAVVELTVAIILCAGVGLAAYNLRMLSRRVDELYHPHVCVLQSLSNARAVALCFGWLLVSLTLSVPTALYVVSGAVPPSNIYGFGPKLLSLSHYTAPLILYCIASLLIPILARWAVRIAYGAADPSRAAQLMVFARLMITVLVPAAYVIILDDWCYGLWSQLWLPCHELGRFDVNLPEYVYVTKPVIPGYYLEEYTTSPMTLVHDNVTVTACCQQPLTGLVDQVTTHSEVCNPSYTFGPIGLCPRAMADTLGQLLLAKLVISAFVGPARMILFQAPAVRRARQWLTRRLLRNPEYEVGTLLRANLMVRGSQVGGTLDAEAAGLVMLLELVLILGFAVPMMLPVAAAAMLMHAMAFELCVQRFNSTVMHEARPPVTYLWFSLALGVAFLLWMFWECTWAGRLVVSAGVPLAGMVGAAVPELVAFFWKSRSVDVLELKEALLAGGENNMETDAAIEQSPHCDGSGRKIDTAHYTADFDSEPEFRLRTRFDSEPEPEFRLRTRFDTT